MEGNNMNITEEQNMNGETNPPLKSNSEPPNDVPSAKKVYSKPTLVILSSTAPQGAKIQDPLESTNLGVSLGS
jgi:hypothetical protein